MLTGIDHVGVAVENLDAAIARYGDVFSIPLVHRETLAEQGVDAALLHVGESRIELIAPLARDTEVARFLERRGEGLHHVAYQVQSVDEALSALAASGVRLIDETPRVGIRGSRVAFLHPSSMGGVLTEIVEPSGSGRS
jgi:methylmalonyl-CoA epimerase